MSVAAPSAPLPDEGSTVAEVRAYAADNGIAVPSRATKAQLLDIVRKA